jgi:hypothetical protein
MLRAYSAGPSDRLLDLPAERSKDTADLGLTFSIMRMTRKAIVMGLALGASMLGFVASSASAKANQGCFTVFYEQRVKVQLGESGIRCPTTRQTLSSYEEILYREPVEEPREHVLVERKWFCESILVPGSKIHKAAGYTCRLKGHPRRRFKFEF